MRHKPDPDPNQRALDFDATPGESGQFSPPKRPPRERKLGERVGMLGRVRLTAHRYKDGKQASAADQKLVLWCIADHAGNGEWFLTYDQIAVETGLSRKRVQRAVAGLRKQGVISCRRKRTRSGRVVNHYRILWDWVQKLGERQRPEVATGDHSGANPEVATGDHSEVATGDHSEVAIGDHSIRKRPIEALPEPPPSPPSPTEAESKSGEMVAAGVGDGVFWGEKLPTSHLTDFEKLAGLFAQALGQGRFGDSDPMALRDWYAWGHYCATAHGIHNRVGLFTSGLSQPDKFGAEWRDKLRAQDCEWAEHQLKQRLPAVVDRQLRRAIEQAAHRSPHVRDHIASVTGLGAILGKIDGGDVPRARQLADLEKLRTPAEAKR